MNRPLQPLLFERSRLRLFGLLCLCPPVVGAGYYCTTLADGMAQAAGWAAVVGGGLGAIALAVQLVQGGTALILSAEGIEDRRLGGGVIRWADIAEVAEAEVHSQRFLCLRLVDRDAYTARLSLRKRALLAANRAGGYGDVFLLFQGLDPGIEEALSYIQAALGRASGPPSSVTARSSRDS